MNVPTTSRRCSRTEAELLRELVRRGQEVRLQVQGSSMEPLLQAGDQVLVGEVTQAELRAGDVLACHDGQRLVVHTLALSLGRGRFRRLWLRGLNNRLPDPPRAPGQVLGRVHSVRRDGRDLPVCVSAADAVGGVMGAGILARSVWERIRAKGAHLWRAVAGG